MNEPASPVPPGGVKEASLRLARAIPRSSGQGTGGLGRASDRGAHDGRVSPSDRSGARPVRPIQLRGRRVRHGGLTVGDVVGERRQGPRRGDPVRRGGCTIRVRWGHTPESCARPTRPRLGGGTHHGPGAAALQRCTVACACGRRLSRDRLDRARALGRSQGQPAGVALARRACPRRPGLGGEQLPQVRGIPEAGPGRWSLRGGVSLLLW